MHEYLLRDLTHAQNQERRRDVERHHLIQMARHSRGPGATARLLARFRHQPAVAVDRPSQPMATPVTGPARAAGLDPRRAA